jgi:hypothetical protein
VRYPLDDRDVIAAEWGDYFRAIDIRFVRDESRLYTRVAGRPPAFGGSLVYLFEYDLERRRRSKVRVDDAALTEECPR